VTVPLSNDSQDQPQQLEEFAQLKLPKFGPNSPPKQPQTSTTGVRPPATATQTQNPTGSTTPATPDNFPKVTANQGSPTDQSVTFDSHFSPDIESPIEELVDSRKLKGKKPVDNTQATTSSPTPFIASPTSDSGSSLSSTSTPSSSPLSTTNELAPNGLPYLRRSERLNKGKIGDPHWIVTESTFKLNSGKPVKGPSLDKPSVAKTTVMDENTALSAFPSIDEDSDTDPAWHEGEYALHSVEQQPPIGFERDPLTYEEAMASPYRP
jgi:hypothetical protein